MKTLKVLGVAASMSLGFASASFAQDVLITQEGDAHKVYEIEIGGSSVYYKLENTPEAVIQKMDKSQVLMIKYQDGRKVFIGEEEKEQVAEKSQQPQAQATTFTPEEEAEIAALNAKFVEEYNQQRVEWTEPKDKKANTLFCTFGLKEGARLQDKNVKIKIESGALWYSSRKGSGPQSFKQDGTYLNQGILVTVENTSPQTVYIDLGNSFFVRNGEASPYYVPSATSTTAGTSGGASVNLGSVAGALGVGGVVGTLAGGVNVGGGTSNSSSTVTYAQRVVAIPSKSAIKLEFQSYFLPNSNYWKIKSTKLSKASQYLKTFPDDIEVNRGEIISYTEEDETLSYGVRIAYSFNETCQQISTLYADIFLKEILGGKEDTYLYYIDTERLSPNWKGVIHMIISN